MPTHLHTLFQPKQANGRDPAYRYRELPPSPMLALFVSCYWQIREFKRYYGCSPMTAVREFGGACPIFTIRSPMRPTKIKRSKPIHLAQGGSIDMKPRITVITIGVDNLEKSVKFYRDGLGFQTEGIVGQEFEHGAVAFFDLEPGIGSPCSAAKIWPMTRKFPKPRPVLPNLRWATT